MTIHQHLLNKSPTRFPNLPENAYRADSDPLILTEIYQPEVHLACWQRSLDSACIDYARWLAERGRLLPLRLITEPEALAAQLQAELPEHPQREAFLTDVSLLTDMFTCLLDMETVGVRISLLKQAMCPRFHVDRIGARMVCTYLGAGTEWLADEQVDRSKLGHGSNGLPDHQSGLYPRHIKPQQVKTGDVLIMKGDTWPGQEGHGVVHRSPACNESTPRLFLSLDVM